MRHERDFAVARYIVGRRRPLPMEKCPSPFWRACNRHHDNGGGDADVPRSLSSILVDVRQLLLWRTGLGGGSCAALAIARARTCADEHGLAGVWHRAAFVFVCSSDRLDDRAHRHTAQRLDRDCGAASVHHAAVDRRRRLVAARRAANRFDQCVCALPRRNGSGPQHLYDGWLDFRHVALSQSLCSPDRESGDGAHGREPGGRLANLRRQSRQNHT